MIEDDPSIKEKIASLGLQRKDDETPVVHNDKEISKFSRSPVVIRKGELLEESSNHKSNIVENNNPVIKLNARDPEGLMIIDNSKSVGRDTFSKKLASAPPAIQKQMLRERLYPLVCKSLLEIDNSENKLDKSGEDQINTSNLSNALSVTSPEDQKHILQGNLSKVS